MKPCNLVGGGAVALALLAPLRLAAADNLYTNLLSGKWETPSNWSLGAPSTNDSIYITNAGTKTVTIDSTTSGSYPGSLTVTNLELGAATGATNTLWLNSAGFATPLHSLSLFQCDSSSLVLVDNSALQVDGELDVAPGGSAGSGAHLVITNGGRLVSASAEVGNTTYSSDDTILVTGNSSIWTNSGRIIATLTIAGTAITVANGGRLVAGGAVYVGDGANSGGTEVLVTDPASSWTNFGTLLVGSYSPGIRFTVSNGATAFSANAMIGNGGDARAIITGTNTSWLSDGTIQVNTNGSLTLSNGAALFVTNASQTALLSIDAGSLLLAGGTFKSDHLLVTNGGTVTTVTNFILAADPGSTNTLTLAGSSFNVASNFLAAGGSNAVALVNVGAGSTLSVTNGVFGLGNSGSTTNGGGTGSLTVSNGAVLAATVTLGSTSGGLGTLEIQSNAIVTVSSNLTLVSSSLLATSLVTVSGGTLAVTNGTVAIGPAGSGEMNLVAGTVIADQIKLGGSDPGSSGSFFVAPGAYVKFLSRLSANFLDVGGEIDGNGGGALYVGEGHDATVFVSQGFIHDVGTITVGYLGGYTGTLTVDTGGVVQAATNVIVGDCASTNQAIGLVTLSGGALYITNAAHTALLDVRNGTFTLNAGSLLVVDNFFITNACAHFVNHGGTIIYNNPLMPAPVLDPTLDADGDGINNGNETLAGTDPLDPSSNLRLLSATVVNGTDVRLDWTAAGGHSYVVQVATNPVGGQLTDFHDLSPVIAVGGTNATTTNYVHVGAVTNGAAFYRVRLAP